MRRIIRCLYNWFKQKKTHYLFPFLTFAIGWWLGMLTNPVIGAIFVSITIYLALVIFVPWDRVKCKKAFMTYLIPAIFCVVIIVPLWNNIVSIFPSPYKEPIRTATASVRMHVSSNESLGNWFMDGRGQFTFGKGQTPLLSLSSAKDIEAYQVGNDIVLYKAIFYMDVANDVNILQNIKAINLTESIEIWLSPLPPHSKVLSGEAIVVLNDSVKLELHIPSQLTREYIIGSLITIRGLTPILDKRGSQIK